MIKDKGPSAYSIPEEIIIAAIQGRLTFFIGNGISQLYGAPSWDGLANAMLEKLVEVEEIDYNHYDLLLKQSTKTRISIADHYFKEDLENGSPKGLSYKDILMKNVSADKYVTYSLLSKLGSRFLTTNYDSLLEYALNQKVEGRIIEASSIEESEKSKSKVSYEENKEVITRRSLEEYTDSDLALEKLLVHLHGSISDESTLVSSSASYIKLYGADENRERLRQLLEGQTVVFVGYGLEELELLELILRSSKEESIETERRFFNLLPLYSHEKEVFEHLQIYYEKQLGIHLLPYLRDKKDFHELRDVIESWSKEISANSMNLNDKLNLLNSLVTQHKGNNER